MSPLSDWLTAFHVPLATPVGTRPQIRLNGRAISPSRPERSCFPIRSHLSATEAAFVLPCLCALIHPAVVIIQQLGSCSITHVLSLYRAMLPFPALPVSVSKQNKRPYAVASAAKLFLHVSASDNVPCRTGCERAVCTSLSIPTSLHRYPPAERTPTTRGSCSACQAFSTVSVVYLIAAPSPCGSRPFNSIRTRSMSESEG
ncbi:uncharacterized protein FOMMEDRAFT_155961 [Fomitiporia mediterranea MF3/22]|uniref:uncharacterized protein n=1 Tax=Fomitiporia mediterranea (strain MF3/22) TaxID=694068 RepID=UPI00044095BC|nr:uncharacterized protein FOMMEDRAFT_155961 [Fomitiporia mediterranea MF3/22]EJD02640.1 hypothetical protein FOMMEDRAFT_155961 [Fomitiporia mediterranea MF3/22]